MVAEIAEFDECFVSDSIYSGLLVSVGNFELYMPLNVDADSESSVDPEFVSNLEQFICTDIRIKGISIAKK